ncbi:hypothetical protein OAO87_03125 [bacterium]|nr:hypothetical protein [bacterium]
MLSMLSEQHASSHRANAISEQLRCCQCCLSSARPANVLTPPPSIYDAVNAVRAARQSIVLTPPPSFRDAIKAVWAARGMLLCSRHLTTPAMLSRLPASNNCADSISQYLRCCQGCLSSARQAIVLTPSPSIYDDVKAV